MADPVELVAYDPHWPDRFEAAAALLRAVLPPGFILRMEHIGSTAVPGLASKPTIDILIGVQKLCEAQAVATTLLAPHGYALWVENPWPDRLLYIRRQAGAGSPRTHHLHMTTMDGQMWECVAFRDLLRRDPAERVAYEAVKRALAGRFCDDRPGYTAGKSGHILAALARAGAVGPHAPRK